MEVAVAAVDAPVEASPVDEAVGCMEWLSHRPEIIWLGWLMIAASTWQEQRITAKGYR